MHYLKIGWLLALFIIWTQMINCQSKADLCEYLADYLTSIQQGNDFASTVEYDKAFQKYQVAIDYY